MESINQDLEIYNCVCVNPKLDSILYMEKIYLKALISLTVNDLVARLWVYKSCVRC